MEPLGFRDFGMFMIGAVASYFITSAGSPVSYVPQNYQETRNVAPFSVKGSNWRGYVECVAGEKSISMEDYYDGTVSSLETALLRVPEELSRRELAREMILNATESFDCSSE